MEASKATSRPKPKMGKPLGTVNEYRKKVRRQGDIANQREIRIRLASPEERAFVEEAAALNCEIKTNRVLPRFIADACLEKAELVLKRPRPRLQPAPQLVHSA